MAHACLLGLPADRLLYGDTVERAFWQAVIDRALPLADTLRDNQARSIANEVGDMLRRAFRRGPRRA